MVIPPHREYHPKNVNPWTSRIINVGIEAVDFSQMRLQKDPPKYKAGQLCVRHIANGNYLKKEQYRREVLPRATTSLLRMASRS